MKIVGLVQARMGSSRLPGKVMEVIEDKPLIGHIFGRLKKVSKLDNIILATTLDERNNSLEEYAITENILVYRHKEENDIIGRLVNAAKHSKADAILKINADCPLIDPISMNKLVDIYINAPIKPDIATNKINYTFPDGYGLELINYKTLMWCNNNIKDKYNRELIVQWIINNPNKFIRISMENDINYSNYGLCVDTQEDLIYIKNIFKLLYKKNNYFGLKDVMKIINSINKD